MAIENKKLKIDSLVQHLSLLPHPEGGFYKETYRSEGTIPKEVLEEGFSGNRNYCTSIYFLLTSDNFSGFHRIKQDEIWNYHSGSTLYVHVISPEGTYHRHELGMDIANGEEPQFVVPKGCWFASSVKAKEDFSLVGCTVAPGFDFDDFELANRAELSALFPQHDAIIDQYTRS